VERKNCQIIQKYRWHVPKIHNLSPVMLKRRCSGREAAQIKCQKSLSAVPGGGIIKGA